MRTRRSWATILLAFACLMVGWGASKSPAGCPVFLQVGEDPSEERNWTIEGTATVSGSSEATVDDVSVMVHVSAGDDSVDTAVAIAEALEAELDLGFYQVDVCSLFVDVVTVAVERMDGTINVFIPPEFIGHNIQEALSLDVSEVDDAPVNSEPTRLSVASIRTASGVEFTVRLDESMELQARVFDVHGRRLAELAHTALPAGVHRFEWDLEHGGRQVPAGVYFGTFLAGEDVVVERIVLAGR